MSDPVVVITRPHVPVHDADLSRRERDALVLTADERRWGRRRVTTQAGRMLALALPTGSTLTPGDILHVATDWYVVIEAAAEPVLAVTNASSPTRSRTRPSCAYVSSPNEWAKPPAGNRPSPSCSRASSVSRVMRQ